MDTACISRTTVCLSLFGQKWRYLVHNRERLGQRAIPWQRHNWCYFVSYLAYIYIGAKFEQNHSDISQVILDFVIYLKFVLKLFVT